MNNFWYSLLFEPFRFAEATAGAEDEPSVEDLADTEPPEDNSTEAYLADQQSGATAEDIAEVMGYDEPDVSAKEEKPKEQEEESEEEEELVPEPESEVLEGEDAGEEEQEDIVEELAEETVTKAQYDALLAQLNELSAKIAGEGEEAPAEAPEQEPEPPKPGQEVNFLSEDDFAEVFSDRSKLNTKLNEVYVAATETAMRAMARSLPQQINQQMTLLNLHQEFWNSNSDLAPYEDYVNTIIAQTERENSDKSFLEILTTAAATAREKLKLPATGGRPSIPSKPKANPPQPSRQKRRVARRAPAPLDATQEAINDILSENLRR